MPKKTTSKKKHSAVPTALKVQPPKPATEAVKPVAEKPVTAEAITAATAPKAEKVAEIVRPTESAPALKPHLEKLESVSTSARATAAVELGKLGDPAAAAPLLASLRDYDADVASDAATALGRLGDTSVVEALIEVVDDANGYFHSVVRAAAAGSLAQLKDVRAVDALLRAVNDPIAEVSAEAIRALASLKDQRAVNSLINVVRDQSGFFVPTVRRAAVLALGSIGGEQAHAELRAVAEDSWEDALIRDEAAQAVR